MRVFPFIKFVKWLVSQNKKMLHNVDFLFKTWILISLVSIGLFFLYKIL